MSGGVDTVVLDEQNQDEAREPYTSSPAKVSALGLTVSVLLRAHLDRKVTRLAACVLLYRLQTTDTGTVTGVPQMIGYSPYDRVELCQIDALGKIVIVHDPRHKPLPRNMKYQIVVGAPSAATYSVQVSCSVGEQADDLVVMKTAEAQGAMGGYLASLPRSTDWNRCD